MIRDCDAYKLRFILGKDKRFFYDIPKYQREYTWGTREISALFNDVVNNENGYFLGSIICVNNSMSSMKDIRLQVIDGQQRLTSLSLFLLAIYANLNLYKNQLLNTPMEDNLRDLKNEIVLYDAQNRLSPRVVPQIQGHNCDDYYGLLNENGLLSDDKYDQKGSSKRKICKAFNFFDKEIKAYISDEKKINTNKEDVYILFDLLDKVNDTVLVFIEVASNRDAYMLFESLNNRGIPLSAIDLIKNFLICKSDKTEDKDSSDKCYKQWERILGNLSDEYGIQERFFRQFYNAYKDELAMEFGFKKHDIASLATKSNMLDIYEKLINKDYQKLLDNLENKSKIYSVITNKAEECDKVPEYEENLLDLERIGGAPSYLLLMRLISEKDTYNLSEADINRIIKQLVKFFVRRNLTDYPNTRNLNKLFINIVSEINGFKNKLVIDKIFNMIVDNSSKDEFFKEKLEGPIYTTNSDVTRFLLCYYENRYGKHQTKEIHIDFWERDKKGKYIWTIEHILPEGNNIPEDWVNMIAAGEKKLAYEIHEECVHTLGNLTLSGYNSNLSNLSFQSKKERKDDKGNNIGYKNGLKLNEDVVTVDIWNKENIDKRTSKLVDVFVRDFDLNCK